MIVIVLIIAIVVIVKALKHSIEVATNVNMGIGIVLSLAILGIGGSFIYKTIKSDDVSLVKVDNIGDVNVANNNNIGNNNALVSKTYQDTAEDIISIDKNGFLHITPTLFEKNVEEIENFMDIHFIEGNNDSKMKTYVHVYDETSTLALIVNPTTEIIVGVMYYTQPTFYDTVLEYAIDEWGRSNMEEFDDDSSIGYEFKIDTLYYYVMQLDEKENTFIQMYIKYL